MSSNATIAPGRSSRHLPRLAKHNVETIDDLNSLTKDDMKTIGLSLGHRNRILKWQLRLTKSDGNQATGEPGGLSPRGVSPGEGTRTLAYTVDTRLKGVKIGKNFLSLYEAPPPNSQRRKRRRKKRDRDDF